MRSSFVSVELGGEPKFNSLCGEVPASQVNVVIKQLLDSGEYEDVIVVTPDYGTRVFCETNEGLITAVGYTREDAEARVNAEFDRLDRASQKQAKLGMEAYLAERFGDQVYVDPIAQAHPDFDPTVDKSSWDYDPDILPGIAEPRNEYKDFHGMEV